MTKASVIIPTYNYGRYIEKAVDSVLSQTYIDVEIIVVDDGSTDNTQEIIKTKYKNKVKYIYQNNKGASAARNKGAKESKGEYLLFLDSDDSFYPRNIEKKIAAFEKKPNVGMVYSDGQYIIDRSKKKSSDWGLSAAGAKLSGDISLLLLRGYRIESSAVCLKTKCFNAVGGFDEDLVALNDYDLFLRISFNYPVLFIDECLFESVRHKGSISSSTTKIDSYKAKSRIINKVERLYSNRAELLGNEWRKLKAAARYFDGNIAFHNGLYHKSCKYYLESIKSYPFQKRVYLLFFVSLIRKVLI